MDVEKGKVWADPDRVYVCVEGSRHGPVHPAVVERIRRSPHLYAVTRDGWLDEDPFPASSLAASTAGLLDVVAVHTHRVWSRHLDSPNRMTYMLEVASRERFSSVAELVRTVRLASPMRSGRVWALWGVDFLADPAADALDRFLAGDCEPLRRLWFSQPWVVPEAVRADFCLCDSPVAVVRDLLRWQVKYGSLASRCADARWHTYLLGRLAEVRDDPFTTLASHLVSRSPMDPSDRVELLRALLAGALVELPS